MCGWQYQSHNLKNQKKYKGLNNEGFDNTEAKDKSPRVFQRDKLKDPLNIRHFPFTPKQQELVDLILNKDNKVIFVDGLAGTSKTYCAVYCALELLNQRKVSDIIFVRSIIESASKSIGTLPGFFEDKFKPFLLPLEDKLSELLSQPDIQYLFNDNRIHPVPINFLRGSSYNAKVIIGEECFVGDTYVITDNGSRPIKSLYQKHLDNQVLPQVLSYNEQNGKFEFKNIISVSNKGFKKVIKVIFGNREVICTPDHLFLTQNNWKRADSLVFGDAIVSNPTDKHQVLNALNEDQKQIFLGSCLGDGYLHNIGNGRYRLKVTHGIKQKEYAEWKALQFNVHSLNYIEKNGYSQKPAVSFSTKAFVFSQDFGDLNEIPQWLLNSIDARALAIWYMDDGYINSAGNHIRLSTCAYNFESQERICYTLRSKFGIDTTIGRDRQYYSIDLNADATRKLLNTIDPYKHKNLDYKFRDNQSAYIWNNQFLNHNLVCFSSKEELRIEREVFDIEVEDNHNFLVCSKTRGGANNKPQSGIVAHNCQNFSFKELTTLITRLGEFSKLICIGDSRQSDLNGRSGFQPMFELFDNEESRQNGIFTFRFTKEDVLRSGILKFILEKLEEYDGKHL